MIRFFKSLYLNNNFFVALAILVFAFILCFSFDALFLLVYILVVALLILLVLDIAFLYRYTSGVKAHRICPDRLSNGDASELTIIVKNNYPFAVSTKIVEEVPFQFQRRDVVYTKNLKTKEESEIVYQVRPTRRGVYSFGNLNVFVTGVFSLISRRYIFNQQQDVAVYPSFVQIRNYELLAASNRLTEYGVKQIRRIGHATEFEQIKDYVQGDDPRTINYKATARTNQLMVNTYNEERSQPVYCVIDKGRSMEMPFEEMALLDYAINSALMIANTALNKKDKAGIITFSNKVDSLLVAESRATQKQKILDLLYTQQTDYKESDFGHLFAILRRSIKQRSLIVIYTNFETLSGLKRQLKYLRLIAKDHLLVIAFFMNTEFDNVLDMEANSSEDFFRKGVAEKLSYDKRLIVKELNRNGIHTILSTPENLTINSINKYLELKSRGLV